MDFQHKHLTLCSASTEGNITELEHSNLSSLTTLHRVFPRIQTSSSITDGAEDAPLGEETSNLTSAILSLWITLMSVDEKSKVGSWAQGCREHLLVFMDDESQSQSGMLREG